MEYLNLSWNPLFGPEPLSQCFFQQLLNFIRKNNCIIHVDLSHTMMEKESMKELLQVVYKDITIQVLHLCGNPGHSKEMIK